MKQKQLRKQLRKQTNLLRKRLRDLHLQPTTIPRLTMTIRVTTKHRLKKMFPLHRQ